MPSDSVRFRVPESTTLIERIEGIVDTFGDAAVGTFTDDVGESFNLMRSRV